MVDNNIINELLINFPFINNMTFNNYNTLINVINKKVFQVGTLLMEDGDECGNIVLLLEGTIRVYKLSPQGKEITLYRINKGETCILSVSCIMSDTTYPAFAEVEDVASLITIPYKYFKEFMGNDIEIQKYVFKLLSSKLIQVMTLIEEITFKSMNTRVAEFLYESVKKNNGDKLLMLTHEEISKELGTAREVISRLLKEFEKEGFILLSRGKIEILQLEMLKSFSVV